ncbi:MAG: hypothetical protein MZV64_00160 [Ignavibacteriales bacterium]|nr:hypothetical protein [Ignavibacteriales bacterium]
MRAAPPTLVLVTADPNASPTPTPFNPPTRTTSPSTRRRSSRHSRPLRRRTPRRRPSNSQRQRSRSRLSRRNPRARSTRSYALLDYYGNQLAVDETVAYTNQTGVALNELVMAVEPMHRGGFTHGAHPARWQWAQLRHHRPPSHGLFAATAPAEHADHAGDALPHRHPCQGQGRPLRLRRGPGQPDGVVSVRGAVHRRLGAARRVCRRRASRL